MTQDVTIKYLSKLNKTPIYPMQNSNPSGKNEHKLNPTNVIFEMSDEQIADVVVSMAKAGETEVYVFDALDNKRLKKIDIIASMKILRSAASHDEKKELLGATQKVMSAVAGKEWKSEYNAVTEKNNSEKAAKLANVIITKVKKHSETPIKMDDITPQVIAKAGKIVTKKISSLDGISDKKKKGLFRNAKTIIRDLYGIKMVNPMHAKTKDERLAIIANEYVDAAQRFIENGCEPTIMINKSKLPLLKANKAKYKGAINFNEFSVFEIKKAISKTVDRTTSLYITVNDGLDAIASIQAKEMQKMYKLRSAHLSRQR